MSRQISSVKLTETYLDNLTSIFNCCKLYIDNSCVWDDTVDVENYITYTCAIENFFRSHLNDNMYVKSIKIKVVEFHHSIIKITTCKRSK